MLSMKSLCAALLSSSLLFANHASAGKDFNHHRREREAKIRQADERARDAPTLAPRASDYRYYTNDTEPYFIKHFPQIPFDTGEFYGGNVPIDTTEPNRTLYFIFKPSTGPPVDEIVIWLNGGPGCSSLDGFFQENGPFLWQPGQYAAVENPYAWTNITNMLWIEQPVGTGFTTGEVRAHNEVDIAKDFVKFFKNWQDVFGIQNYRIFVTGESYAGRYVPYISAEILNQNDKTNFDLEGAIVFDPCIGSWEVVQEEIPTFPFVEANNNILNLNDTTMAALKAQHESCGYADWYDTYLQFPPPGNQPQVPTYNYSVKCDIFDAYIEAATDVNPCYNIYHITDYCPLLGDTLSTPGLSSTPAKPCLPQTEYFNQTAVKEAIHAPVDISWSICGGPVFLGPSKGPGLGPEGENDLSPDPIQAVLPQVIEGTNRVMVGNADWDSIIITNGTLLAIQNMTWNGQLGFQEAPSSDIIVPTIDLQYGVGGPQGVMGRYHFERGLMWTETYQAGHEQPQYQPRVTLRYLQWLLGRIDDL